MNSNNSTKKRINRGDYLVNNNARIGISDIDDWSEIEEGSSSMVKEDLLFDDNHGSLKRSRSLPKGKEDVFYGPMVTTNHVRRPFPTSPIQQQQRVSSRKQEEEEGDHHEYDAEESMMVHEPLEGYYGTQQQQQQQQQHNDSSLFTSNSDSSYQHSSFGILQQQRQQYHSSSSFTNNHDFSNPPAISSKETESSVHPCSSSSPITAETDKTPNTPGTTSWDDVPPPPPDDEMTFSPLLAATSFLDEEPTTAEDEHTAHNNSQHDMIHTDLQPNNMDNNTKQRRGPRTRKTYEPLENQPTMRSTTDIQQPQENDVLFGRQPKATSPENKYVHTKHAQQQHTGNLRLKQWAAQELCWSYQKSKSHKERHELALQLVHRWQTEHGGRFLNFDPQLGSWQDVGHTAIACAKAARILRETKPTSMGPLKKGGPTSGKKKRKQKNHPQQDEEYEMARNVTVTTTRTGRKVRIPKHLEYASSASSHSSASSNVSPQRAKLATRNSARKNETRETRKKRSVSPMARTSKGEAKKAKSRDPNMSLPDEDQGKLAATNLNNDTRTTEDGATEDDTGVDTATLNVKATVAMAIDSEAQAENSLGATTEANTSAGSHAIDSEAQAENSLGATTEANMSAGSHVTTTLSGEGDTDDGEEMGNAKETSTGIEISRTAEEADVTCATQTAAGTGEPEIRDALIEAAAVLNETLPELQAREDTDSPEIMDRVEKLEATEPSPCIEKITTSSNLPGDIADVTKETNEMATSERATNSGIHGDSKILNTTPGDADGSALDTSHSIYGDKELEGPVLTSISQHAAETANVLVGADDAKEFVVALEADARAPDVAYRSTALDNDAAKLEVAASIETVSQEDESNTAQSVDPSIGTTVDFVQTTINEHTNVEAASCIEIRSEEDETNGQETPDTVHDDKVNVGATDVIETMSGNDDTNRTEAEDTRTTVNNNTTNVGAIDFIGKSSGEGTTSEPADNSVRTRNDDDDKNTSIGTTIEKTFVEMSKSETISREVGVTDSTEETISREVGVTDSTEEAGNSTEEAGNSTEEAGTIKEDVLPEFPERKEDRHSPVLQSQESGVTADFTPMESNGGSVAESKCDEGSTSNDPSETQGFNQMAESKAVVLKNEDFSSVDEVDASNSSVSKDQSLEMTVVAKNITSTEEISPKSKLIFSCEDEKSAPLSSAENDTSRERIVNSNKSDGSDTTEKKDDDEIRPKLLSPLSRRRLPTKKNALNSPPLIHQYKKRRREENDEKGASRLAESDATKRGSTVGRQEKAETVTSKKPQKKSHVVMGKSSTAVASDGEKNKLISGDLKGNLNSRSVALKNKSVSKEFVSGKGEIDERQDPKDLLSTSRQRTSGDQIKVEAVGQEKDTAEASEQSDKSHLRQPIGKKRAVFGTAQTPSKRSRTSDQADDDEQDVAIRERPKRNILAEGASVLNAAKSENSSSGVEMGAGLVDDEDDDGVSSNNAKTMVCTKCASRRATRDCPQNCCRSCCTNTKCEKHTAARERLEWKQEVLEGRHPIQEMAREVRKSRLPQGRFREPGFVYVGDTVVIWNLYEYNQNVKWREDAIRRSIRRKTRNKVDAKVKTTSRRQFLSWIEASYQAYLKEHGAQGEINSVL